MKKTYGEIAYEAYCKSREWKSVSRKPLPPFNKQTLSLQESWEAAGKAIAEDIALETGRG